MTHRERLLAVLNYQPYDRLPVVHFGYWGATLEKWAAEGHLTEAEAAGWQDGNAVDVALSRKLGFDFNYYMAAGFNCSLLPTFAREVLEVLPDGARKVMNEEGVVVLEKPGTVSIPAEIDHTLKSRADWEEHYLPRLAFHEDRVRKTAILVNEQMVPYESGGLDFLREDTREYPYGLFCGSLFGVIRNIVGIVNVSYMYAEDPVLYQEIIDTMGELCYQVVARVLRDGAKFDFGHFWEDICFRSGPLVIPSVFDELVGPHYHRITALLKAHDIPLVSLDCDGCIDALIPTWLNNGVNVMFPIEVGAWKASIAPWRERYGRELRGVGGMDKVVFTRDFAAVDAEIERLRPLVDLGGYLPCPDHRIAPDALWDNVRYYCDRMHEVFAG